MRRWIPIVAAIAVSCSQPPEKNDADGGDDDDVVVIDDDASNPSNGENDASVSPPNDTGSDAGVDCTTEGCDPSQVCNMQTGECVDCLTDNECGENGFCNPDKNACECKVGFHYCDGTCVDDTSVDTCGTSCEPCATDPNGATSCDGTACSLDCDDGYVLDDDSCVECVMNDDCTDPAASVCQAGACIACSDNDGCSHFADAPICSGDGVCVECTTADDSACGGNSCDPSTGTCTVTPKESVAVCRECVADSECMADHACVPMEFDGVALATAFCLPVDDGSGCEGPYGTPISGTSASGVMGDYCSINEAIQTCEALLDYNEPCGDPSDCGATGLDDGLCEQIDFEIGARCTVRCTETAECPPETVTGCGLGGDYCGSF